MTYQDDAALYTDQGQRTRMEMCAREQALIFQADGRPDIAQLGHGVVSGVPADIDALIAAVCVQDTAEPVAESDPALLGAMQAVWPSVARARYPEHTPPTTTGSET